MATFKDYETDRTRAEAAAYDGAEVAPGAGSVGTLINWAGAAVSLALVVGMGVWAWQLTVRDVSGVPVIEALEGPMRVPPADPGGAQAPHQGLAVNRIAEGAAAAPVPERVVLAPPPVDLEGVQLVSASAPAPRPIAEAAETAEAAAGAETADAPTPALADAEITPERVSSETQALIERLLARGDDALAPVAAVEAPAVVDSDAPVAAASPAAGPEIAVIPASVPGVARSLRPALRPAALRAAPAPQATPAAASGPIEIDPDTLEPGTRLVQLGAFDSAEVARDQWQRLAARFPDFFAGRGRVIQEASAGGAPFYRLRAHGFADLDASRRFCAALMAQGAACIPVTVR
jgi:hypothetical protein